MNAYLLQMVRGRGGVFVFDIRLSIILTTKAVEKSKLILVCFFDYTNSNISLRDFNNIL